MADEGWLLLEFQRLDLWYLHDGVLTHQSSIHHPSTEGIFWVGWRTKDIMTSSSSSSLSIDRFGRINLIPGRLMDDDDWLLVQQFYHVNVYLCIILIAIFFGCLMWTDVAKIVRSFVWFVALYALSSIHRLCVLSSVKVRTIQSAPLRLRGESMVRYCLLMGSSED